MVSVPSQGRGEIPASSADCPTAAPRAEIRERHEPCVELPKGDERIGAAIAPPRLETTTASSEAVSGSSGRNASTDGPMRPCVDDGPDLRGRELRARRAGRDAGSDEGDENEDEGETSGHALRIGPRSRSRSARRVTFEGGR